MPKLTYRIPEEDREQKARAVLRRWENWIMIMIGAAILAVLMILLLGLVMRLAFNS